MIVITLIAFFIVFSSLYIHLLQIDNIILKEAKHNNITDIPIIAWFDFFYDSKFCIRYKHKESNE